MNNPSNPLGTDYLLNSLSGRVIIYTLLAYRVCCVFVCLQAQGVGEAYLCRKSISFSSSSSLFRVIVKTPFGFRSFPFLLFFLSSPVSFSVLFFFFFFYFFFFFFVFRFSFLSFSCNTQNVLQSCPLWRKGSWKTRLGLSAGSSPV